MGEGWRFAHDGRARQLTRRKIQHEKASRSGLGKIRRVALIADLQIRNGTGVLACERKRRTRKIVTEA